MDERVSRRRVLYASVAGATIGGLGAIRARASRDRTTLAPDGLGASDAVAASTGRSPSGESKGFARAWATTHVQDRETVVTDVVPSLGDGDAFVVGETSHDQDYTNRRVWVGEFDETGARWTRVLRADGPSETARIAVRDGHYVVFWNGVNDDVQKDRVTKISPDGNVRWQRAVAEGFGGYRDVVVLDDGYVVLDGDVLRKLTTDLDPVAAVELSPPRGYGVGRGTETIVPVADGFVVTGTVLGDDTDQALWAVKVDGVDGSDGAVQWSEAYAFEDNAFGGYGTAVDDGVAIVGSLGGGWDDPIAMLVGPDGDERWRAIPSVDGGSAFTGVHVADEGVRAVGEFDDDLGVVTFDASGSVVERWQGAGDEEVYDPVVGALGDDRYVVGAKVNDASVDSRGFVARLEPNQPPTPAVSVSPSEPNATEAVWLDASETTDPDTSVDRFEWDVSGDGSVDETGEKVKTRFASAGTHDVLVRAIDVYGAVGERVVSVSVGENTPPSASLSVGDASPVVGDAVAFEATDVSDAESSVASVAWTVDDDAIDASGREASIRFESPGEHVVAASLTDTGGASTTVEVTVTVAERPTFTGTTTTGDSAADGNAQGDEDSSGGTSPDGQDDANPLPGFGVGATALAAGAFGALAARFGSASDSRRERS